MTKPYTWNEIKSVLEAELVNTEHIMTYGTLGSNNVEKDIDTVITKKPNSRSAEFYREIHNIFEHINIYLKEKYSCKLIRISRFDHEEEVQFIAKKETNDLVFHVMTYISYPQIEKHWGVNWIADDIVGESITDYIKSSYDCILGSKSDLFSKSFSKNIKYEGVFTYLNDLDRINSNYPEKFLVNVMNASYDYLLRKRLHKNSLQGSTREEIKEIFYKTCDLLDRMEERK